MKCSLIVSLLLACLSSCVSIKTYQLDRYYSEDVADPGRVILQQKLDGLMEILDDDCSKSKLSYVVNGQYLTLKVKNRCESELDSIIYYTLCNKFSTKNCGEVIKKH
ncbi:hypothetical protein BFR04_06650 [Gaetbulibacter sp. 4G1]|nr:hypothetical protein BFR04_06650 [Gaetbulibacter sp. 4G1]